MVDVLKCIEVSDMRGPVMYLSARRFSAGTALLKMLPLILLLGALLVLAPQRAYAYQDVYLENGQTYNLSSAGKATWLHIDKGGVFTLTGSSHRVLVDVSIPRGQTASIILDGVTIDPDGSAPGVAWADRSGITISETGGAVKLLSQSNTVSRVTGYGPRPAIRKDGTSTQLVFATTDPARLGTIIATASSSSFRTSGIGAYTPNAFHNSGNTFGNVVFESGRIEAYGSRGNSLTTGGPGIGADVGGNVDGITISGGHVKAVAGDMSAAAIGTSSADVIYLIWPTLVGYTIFPRDVKNISITGGTVEALHATDANYGGAGIGGGNGCSANGIAISGGTILAEGSTGIGGGYNGDGLNINISGGTVVARGSETGIGGGSSSGSINDIASAMFGNVLVNISGGTVDAKADMVKADGVGIGGWQGVSNPTGRVSITGGTVNAVGQGCGAGIGGGFYGSLKEISISGGTVRAQGGDDGFGIGRMEDTFGSSGNPIDSVIQGISISGGTLSAIGGKNVSKDIGAYSKVKLFSTPEKTPLYISGGNVKAAKGMFNSPKQSPGGPEVFVNTVNLDTYGYENDLSQHRVTSLTVEGYPAGYSYGTHDMRPFADSSAATLYVWIPAGAGVKEAKIAPGCSHMVNLDTQFKGFPVPGAVTLYPETPMKLSAGINGIADGVCFAWHGSTEHLFQAVGERKGYKVAGYTLESGGTTLLLDAKGTLLPNVSGYTDGLGRWIGSNRQNYDNLVLYAQWVPLSYAIGFEANYPNTASTRQAATGSMGDVSATVGTPQVLPSSEFALPGYAFSGWNTQADGSGASYADGAQVLDLVSSGETRAILFAQWQPDVYEIVFDPGDAPGVQKTQQLVFDEAAALDVNLFVKGADTFIGWDAAGFGRVYEDRERVLNVCTLDSTGNPVGRVLTARWAALGKINIVVTRDDALWKGLEVTLVSEVNRVPLAWDAQTDTYFYQGVLSPENYEVEIAKGGAIYDTEGIIVKPGDRVLHIDYGTVSILAEPHAVATINAQTDPLIVLEGRKVTLTTTVDKGYVFESYTAIGYQPIWQNDDPTISTQQVIITGATLIEAHPAPLHFTVLFDGNGGAGMPSSQEFIYGEPQNLSPNEYARAGYVFAGWTLLPSWTGKLYSDGELVDNLSDTGGVITLYAQWNPNPYFIKYEGNGVFGAMLDQKCFHDIESPLADKDDVTFEHENFQLVEWNTKADGSGIGYMPGQHVMNLTDENSAMVVLFAQWERERYTVVFDANGASGVMEPQVMSRGLREPLDSVGFNYHLHCFVSWNTSPDGSGMRYEGSEPVQDLVDTGGTITLYAQWSSSPDPQPINPIDPGGTAGSKTGDVVPRVGDSRDLSAVLLALITGSGLVVVGLLAAKRKAL